MNRIPIEVPEPSQYVSHLKVEEIANELNKFYRTQLNHPEGHIVDVEDFITNSLGIKIIWEAIPEPENRICFAQVICENDGYKITLNQNHHLLFSSKPELLRSCLSHEIGHCVLRHFECLNTNENQGNLFNAERNNNHFHDSAWRQLGLSHEDFIVVKNELAKTAWNKKEDKELLDFFNDYLEPKWMYWQAEQFSSCFLIPHDKLFDYLETGLNLADWNSLYWLRDKFGVSISMVRIRLEKLKLIEFNDGKLTIVPKPIQNKIC